MRTAREVFESHLKLSYEGTVEEDLRQNYADDVLILSGRGVHRGHEGMREMAELLRKQLPECTFYYKTRLVEGELAFLEWTATAEGARVDDGADSYVIRDERIVAQTIHYNVKPA